MAYLPRLSGRQNTLICVLLFAGVLTAACGGESDDAGARAEADDGPTIETYFTRPTAEADDHILEDLVIDMLDEVPDDATVRAAYYTFSRTEAAEAFGDAHDRGVDLELILDNENRHDDGSDWRAVEILRDRLGSDSLTICRDGDDSGGCQGPGIQHNKFIAFSETGDGTEDVVLQSSANLTNPQLHQFNNTVVIREDPSLYGAYIDYWQDLKAAEFAPNYYRTFEGDGPFRVHFFPRQNGDPIIEILEGVDCSEGATIHVGMAYFTDPRVEIAQRLADLADGGCEVHALVRRGSGRVGLFVYPTLEDSAVELSAFDDGDHVTIHSKYLLIDGMWNGNNEQIVWTGAHNYTGPALGDNDETLLQITDDEVYQAFLDDWSHAQRRATSID